MNLHASATIHLHAYISLNMFYLVQQASALENRLLLLSSDVMPCGIPEINLSHVPCSSPSLTRALHLLYYLRVFSFSVLISWSNRGVLSVPLDLRSSNISSKAAADDTSLKRQKQSQRTLVLKEVQSNRVKYRH